MNKLDGFVDYCKFHCLGDDIVKSIIPFMKMQVLEKGQVLIQKGNSWDKFYCILKGRIIIDFRNEEKLNTNDELLVDSSIKINKLNGLQLIKSADNEAFYSQKGHKLDHGILSIKKTASFNIENFYKEKEHELKKQKDEVNYNNKKICKLKKLNAE